MNYRRKDLHQFTNTARRGYPSTWCPSYVMPTHVFLGTESAQVLCGELADGSFQYRGRVAVSDAAAPAGKHGFAAKTAGAPYP